MSTEMGSPTKLTTTVSTKGQVILPKTIREHRNWDAGTRLIVEETADGVLLKAERVFPLTRPEDVFCSLRYDGPAKTVEEMDAAITAEVKERHARGRY
jgi:AbrB family looped-hinge helix DNA binding protein